MKILLDPVYTNLPSQCSTSYLGWQILSRIFEQRDDAFAYVLYPAAQMEDETEREWVDSWGFQDRVTLIPYNCYVYDRMSELYKFSTELRNLLVTPDPRVWDTEVIITSRISQIPMIRANAGRWISGTRAPEGSRWGSVRGIFGFDEMPIYSFMHCLLWKEALDPATLSAYLLSDRVVVSSLWAKREIMQLARQWLAPSKLLQLEGLIMEGTPVPLTRVKRKAPTSKDSGLTVVFTGRTTATRNYKGVVKLFASYFASAKRKVRFAISTNSKATNCGTADLSYIDIRRNSRAKFYEFMKTEADVVVNLSPTEDFSLSTYEPLALGVPLIVKDAPWSDFLGKEYPFRVKTLREAYGLITLFSEDYVGMYSKFLAWENTFWARIVKEREGQVTDRLVAEAAIRYVDVFHARVKEIQAGGEYRRRIAREVPEDATGELDISYMIDTDTLTRPTASASRMPNFPMLKVLMNERGWRDTKQCGVFVK